MKKSSGMWRTKKSEGSLTYFLLFNFLDVGFGGSEARKKNDFCFCFFSWAEPKDVYRGWRRIWSVQNNFSTINSDLHLVGTLSRGRGGCSEIRKQAPENALFPGAGLYGKGFLFFFPVDPMSPKNPIYMFAFSQGLLFSENNSEAGFGQISKFLGVCSMCILSDFGLRKS